jgi:hypothetical protein
LAICKSQRWLNRSYGLDKKQTNQFFRVFDTKKSIEVHERSIKSPPDAGLEAATETIGTLLL